MPTVVAAGLLSMHAIIKQTQAQNNQNIQKSTLRKSTKKEKKNKALTVGPNRLC